MKKIMAYVLCVFVLSTSCSSDEVSTNNYLPPTTSKVIKLIKTKNRDSSNETYYNYEGNKLISITNNYNLEKVEITYEGNYITEVIKRDNLGQIQYETTYEYSNGKLSKRTQNEISTNNIIEEYLSYSLANSVIIIRAFQSTNGGTTFSLLDQSKLSLNSNRDVISKDYDYDSANDSYNATVTFEYDNKNNPFKNVVGLDKIKYMSVGYEVQARSTINNEMRLYDVQNGTAIEHSVKHYSYNSNNYPISSSSSVNSIVLNYFYQ
ncbi:hypothetical protein EQG63_09300 [Flavobacterium amnicola]|uniref:YD repeat-containing protein n=1 Tax=Flavobacterium amnicola TaxID=2506422 RepID=A0A4Q1K270_9FLAO|nr:hypothetical protein [Flavobacterium amnicola]RXR18452.1 hypothetical protein EQG63_09300 [Flavobacterium amnicola]